MTDGGSNILVKSDTAVEAGGGEVGLYRLDRGHADWTQRLHTWLATHRLLYHKMKLCRIVNRRFVTPHTYSPMIVV